MDQYTETTTTGWGSRFGNSFKGIVVGIVLFVAATALLYWNEGRTVKTGDSINEAKSVTVPLGDTGTVAADLNGKVVYGTGRLTTEDSIGDDAFGAKGVALSVNRQVEFYQWQESTRTEKKKKVGGGEETVTTYSYNKGWGSSPVDSSNFKYPDGHENTTLLTVEDENWYAPNAHLGAYRFPTFLVSEVSGSTPLNAAPTDEQLAALAELLNVTPETQPAQPTQQPAQPAQPAQVESSQLEASPAPQPVLVPQTSAESAAQPAQPEPTSQPAPEAGAQAAAAQPAPAQPEVSAELALARQYVHPRANVVYIGLKPNAPSVGDVRITYKQVLPCDVSFVAKLVGDTFDVYTASNGYKFHRLENGTVAQETLFADAHSANKTMAWILRVLGIVLVCSGLGMLLRPLSVVADVLPFLGDLVGAGTGLVAFLLGLAWSFIIIAIAWLAYRPLLGGGLLAAAIALIVLIFLRREKRAKAPAQE